MVSVLPSDSDWARRIAEMTFGSVSATRFPQQTSYRELLMRNTGMVPAKPLPFLGPEALAHVFNMLESELNTAVLEQNMDSKYFGWDVARRRFRSFAGSPAQKPAKSSPSPVSIESNQEPEPAMLPDNSFEPEVVEMSGSNITGARGLAGAFRDRLSAARARIVAAQENMGSAMDELERTASQADSLVKEVEREAADLAAAIGTLSNGGPALDE